MKLLKSKFKPLVLVALLSMIGSVQAASFSSLTVGADTATNLDVSWSWNTLQASTTGETFQPTLSHWTAKATGVDLSDFYVMKVYAGFSNDPFEFKSTTGTDAEVLFSHVTKTFGTHTYNLDVSKAAGSGTWNAHLTGVAPIPEPGEWALMLSGLGLIGFMVRRRTADVA